MSFSDQRCGRPPSSPWRLRLAAAPASDRMQEFDIVRYRRTAGHSYWRTQSLLSRPSRAGCVFALSVVIWLSPRLGLTEVLEQKFDGVVVPRLWVQVVPKVDGVISRVLLAPGQRVSKGDVLFEIDQDDFAIGLSIAQAELDEARARLSMAEDIAGRQAQMLKQNATSKQAARQSEIEVEIARAIVARNEGALAKAQLELSRTHVVAPLSGIVGRPHVAPGAFVEAKSGTVLAEIAQLDPILVSFYVPYDERQRAFEKVGTSTTEELFKRSTLSLELPSGREYEHSGKPEYQGGQIDQSTSMMTVWAEFPNPDHILVPGLKVHVVSHLAD
jgi:membrane fusion protein, multidrug efflux system